MLSSQTKEAQPAPSPPVERQALRWAALLCGQERLPDLGLHGGEIQVLSWAATHLDTSSGLLSSGRLPEPFQTIRFLQETKTFDAATEQLKRIVHCLRTGEMGLVQAMVQVSEAFNDDEVGLLRWKELAEDLPRFLHWLPAFEASFDYLNSTFATPVEELEEIRKELLAASAEPQRFLRPLEREQFDHSFVEFKKGYIDYYHSVHEDTVHIVGNQEKMESKVDSMALRNLELLSDLDNADKSYLNRVRALGKWVQAHQCDLPVREILARSPRCYCNFNPEASSHLAKSIEQMNETIRQGVDHFRAILRKCRMLIILELKNLRIDDYHSKQIAALLSRGPMIPLKQQTISILNAIMQKHADAFRSEVQRT